MVTASDVLPLRTEQDVVLARQAVRRHAQALGFSIVDQTKIVTAASELARNTLIHGKGGILKWELLSEDVRKGLRLTFEDEGPGIPDLGLALTDGWTSGAGLGMGLSGARRLVSEFDIRSEPGRGTTVVVARWT